MTTRHWWRTHPNALLRFLALSISFTLASLTCFQTPLPAASRRISYYHTDHLGSTTTVTNEQGQVVAHAEYTPYGATVTQTGTPQPTHQFTGQRLDANTGLYYYNARYYDPQLGRFVQADPYIQNPVDPQALNRYAYVRNNPTNLVDSTGYSFWSAIKSFFRRAFGGGDDSSGIRISLIPDGPAITINTERKEVGVVGQQNGPYGYAQSGLYYNWGSQQAGYRTGAYGYGGEYSAEGRVYYDFANDQAGASFGAGGYGSDFYANTDGQRHLTVNGESIRIKAAKAGEFGAALGGPPSPATLQAIEDAGWMAVGGALMAGSAGATVTTGSLAVGIAAPLAIGGAAIAGVGALQVSYAVRAPFDTYPGQTQGKITRELNKAYRALTYGGPAKEIGIGGPNGPGNWQKMKLGQKIGFVVWHAVRAFRPMAESVLDFYTRQ